MDEFKDLLAVQNSPTSSNFVASEEVEKPRYTCPICRDAKMVEHPAGGWTRCQCHFVAKAKKILETSGINPEDRDKSFGSFKTRGINSIDEAKINAIHYYKHFDKNEGKRPNSIAFLGMMNGGTKLGVGTGKTHLGIALTNNLLNKGVEVVYMSYREEITRIKQAVTDEESYRKLIDKFKCCRVLFVDDLFKGKVTEADINVMFEIVNHRYLCRKPIIITSEFDSNKLNEIDEALASRLYEMCKDCWNIMGGSESNFRYQGTNII